MKAVLEVYLRHLVHLLLHGLRDEQPVADGGEAPRGVKAARVFRLRATVPWRFWLLFIEPLEVDDVPLRRHQRGDQLDHSHGAVAGSGPHLVATAPWHPGEPREHVRRSAQQHTTIRDLLDFLMKCSNSALQSSWLAISGMHEDFGERRVCCVVLISPIYLYSIYIR